MRVLLATLTPSDSVQLGTLETLDRKDHPETHPEEKCELRELQTARRELDKVRIGIYNAVRAKGQQPQPASSHPRRVRTHAIIGDEHPSQLYRTEAADHPDPLSPARSSILTAFNGTSSCTAGARSVLPV